jgi:serine/threonine-protein kinase
MQACAAVLEEEPPPPRQLRPALPAALSDTIMRCLRKTPEARFADVAELAEALGPYSSERFVGYPARCRAYLNGEGLGRRSTPSALAAVRLNTGMHMTMTGTGPLATVQPSAKPQLLAVRLDSSPIAPSDRRSQPEGRSEETVATTHLAAATHSTGRLIGWSAFTTVVLAGTLAGYLALRDRPARLVSLQREPITSVLPRAAVPPTPPPTPSAAGANETPTLALPPEGVTPNNAPLTAEPLNAADSKATAAPKASNARKQKLATRTATENNAKRAATSDDPDVGF